MVFHWQWPKSCLLAGISRSWMIDLIYGEVREVAIGPIESGCSFVFMSIGWMSGE